MFEIWQILLTGWIVIFFFMTILWYIGKRKNNYTIVDVGWTLSLVILCILYFFMGDGYLYRKIMITGMVSFWGIRLGGYLLFTRVLTDHSEDQRYAAFRKDYGDKVHQKFLKSKKRLPLKVFDKFL